MIDIVDTEGFDLKDFENLVTEQLKDNNQIEVYIPKYTQQFFNSAEDIAEDYLTLSTVGHILNKASTSFQYEKVAPALHQSVKFTLTAKDKKEFIKVLQEISFFYTDNLETSGDDDYDDFFISETKGEFLDFAENNTIACPYFYDIYLEYQQIVSNEEE